MRISDWSSDVCSSDLEGERAQFRRGDDFCRVVEHGWLACALHEEGERHAEDEWAARRLEGAHRRPERGRIVRQRLHHDAQLLVDRRGVRRPRIDTVECVTSVMEPSLEDEPERTLGEERDDAEEEG